MAGLNLKHLGAGLLKARLHLIGSVLKNSILISDTIPP